MIRVLLKRLIAGATALVATAPAFAQCAMCRTAVASQGAEVAKTIDFAIIILLLPAVGMFCGVYFYAYKNRNSERAEERWER